MSFNRDFAAKYYDIVAKLDDDSADMFTRMVVHGVLMEDLENNRRSVSKAVEEILGEIRDEVSKSLQKREGQPQAHAVASLVGLVSKARPDLHPDIDDWRDQKRDKSGRWTVNFSATKEKNKPSRYSQNKGKHTQVGDFDVTSALAHAGKETSRFADKWQERGTDEYSTTSNMYNRISAGSRVLAETGNATGNAKLRLAGEAGKFLGEFGPQAEQVIGPHMRRTAYRYRGTERTPDPAIAIQVRDNIANIGRSEGLTDNSQFTTPMMNTASHRAAVNYLSKRIPKKSLAELQSKSGKIPPSEGVIINADGKIITQAVGYMDDHYLPFNLKNLKGLQGGSYVRTRSSGGLTTEDIYTGLMSGARSVTVVSRSGVFTMDFEDDFRGGRRFNDKAHGMINRYAKTLDAVKSKQVTRAPMSMEDRLRIRDEVEDEMAGFRPDEIEDEIKRRVTEAQSRPTLSQREMDEINAKAVEAAAEGGQGPRGQFGGRDWERIKDDPKKRILAYRSQMIEDALREKEATKFQLDGEGYAVALDALQEQFPYYIANVQYIHNKDPRAQAMGLSPETDSGYVKPRYNRPEGAKEGYFDPSIGSPKISADKTNYQNWQHRKGSLKPVAETEGGEGAAKPKGGPQSSKAAQVKNAVAQGHAEAGVNKELRALVDETRDVILPEGEQFKTISQAREANNLDQILGDPTKAEDLEKALRALHGRLEAEHGENASWAQPQAKAMADRLRVIDTHRVVLGGDVFDPAAYKGGPSPETPWVFQDNNAYLAGQEPEVYQAEWDKLDDRIKKHFPDFPGLPADPKRLREMADAFGKSYQVAMRAKEGGMDETDIIRRLSSTLDAVNASPADVRRFAHAVATNPDVQMRRWSEVVDVLERARRIKSVAPDVTETKAAPAAGKDVIQGEAKEIRGGDNIRDFTAQIEKFSNDHPDVDVRDAFNKIHRGLIADKGRGDIETIMDGLADLKDASTTEQAELIRNQLKRLGIIGADFDND